MGVYGIVDYTRLKASVSKALEDASVPTNRLQLDDDGDLYVAGRAVEGSADYTTTDALEEVLSIDSREFDKLTIMIKNTGSTNNADIAVYTLANSSGSIEYEEYTATLAPGDVAKIQLSGRYAKVVIRAKSTTSGASTTLRVEWIGGK